MIFPSGFDVPTSSQIDQIDDARRLDPNAPIVYAYLGGRPVALVRPDPSTRAPGMPADMTVPISMSRLRYARDIELDRATMPFEPTPIAGGVQPVGDKETETIYFVLFAGVLLGLAAWVMQRQEGYRANPFDDDGEDYPDHDPYEPTKEEIDQAWRAAGEASSNAEERAWIFHQLLDELQG